ncbi:MAG: hypothetical protein HY735_33110 [Verrucomicrobia bacterium]|nr:hypothetical protein [Verrucomicrobiota bacterium]
MKIIITVSLLALSLFFTSVGCQHQDDGQLPGGERLALGENPTLLPIERAHPVKLELRAKPASLTEDDLKQISDLVGRIPGLRRYAVTLIRESAIVKGGLDVFVEPVYAVVKKNGNWSIVRIDAPAW